MNGRATRGGITSALGEHLVAALLVLTVVVSLLAGYPALKAQTEGTAERVQTRMHRPFVEAYLLENGTYATTTQVASTPYSP